ncbi:MAG: LytTR family DNA-binding domain-containing protein [Longimicrobiales bacterium]
MNGGATVRALVCEDEPLAARALREYLADVPWVEIVGEAVSGPESLRLIHKHEPDLVFLDVRMPGMSGVEVLDALEHRPAVVFTTAYDEYAVSAFERGAVDYLVKPFGRERVAEAMARVRVRLRGEGWPGTPSARPEPGGAAAVPRRLFARSRGAIVPVPVGEIRRIDADAGGSVARTPGATYELDATLGELEERLAGGDFVRVHRSHLVNLDHVVSIRRYDDRRLSVRFDDGETVVASRTGSQALRALME